MGDVPDHSTTSRVLGLLGLLQTRRSWTGPELAERVGVSGRTVRRDVERLRELGYRVTADRGTTGGYRLEASSDLPPLLFTEDEAIALAVALGSSAADGSLRGIADLAVSALAKLEQVLPPRARSRMQLMGAAIAASGPVRAVDLVDPEVLAALALGCRDAGRVRFSYRDAAGAPSTRSVQPSALVPVGRRWYLLGWDTEREDWRTFRLDRVQDVTRTHAGGLRRDVPGGDAARFVLERLALPWTTPLTATVRIAAPFEQVQARLGPYTTGLSADGAGTLWRIEHERVEVLHGALAWLTWPFSLVDGEELRHFARDFAVRSLEAPLPPSVTGRPV